MSIHKHYEYKPKNMICDQFLQLKKLEESIALTPDTVLHIVHTMLSQCHQLIISMKPEQRES